MVVKSLVVDNEPVIDSAFAKEWNASALIYLCNFPGVYSALDVSSWPARPGGLGGGRALAGAGGGRGAAGHRVVAGRGYVRGGHHVLAGRGGMPDVRGGHQGGNWNNTVLRNSNCAPLF